MKENTIKEIQLEYDNKKYHIVASRVYSGDIDLINKKEGSIALIDNSLKICNRNLEWVTLVTEDKIREKEGVINTEDVFINEDTTLKEHLNEMNKEFNNKIKDLENKVIEEKEKLILKFSDINKEVEEIKTKEYVDKEKLDYEISIIEKKIKNIEVNNGSSGPTIVKSSSEYIEVEDKGENYYHIITNKLEEKIEEMDKAIKKLENSQENNDFLGKIPGYEFDYISDNEEIIEFSSNVDTLILTSKKIKDRVQINKDLRLINFDVYRGYDNRVNISIDKGSSYIYDEVGPLKALNVTIRIKNSSDSELGIESYSWSAKPKDEYGIAIDLSQIKIPPKKVKDFYFTFYTNDESQLLDVFMKEGDILNP